MDIIHLESTAKPISELFPIESKTRYYIPVYQRNYSWNVQNIEDLFDDINLEDHGYYIGNLLVSDHIKVQSTDNPQYDVVDGQQRLTTIALFLAAIHERCDSVSGNTKKIGSLQSDIERKLMIDSNQPRLLLLKPDSTIYQTILNILLDPNYESPKKFGNRIFFRRYRYIRQLLFETFSDYESLRNFYDKLNDVILLQIRVVDISDAFNVFSSLNSKGLPLTLIDLLKAQFLKSSAEGSLPPEDAEDKWSALTTVFTHGDSQVQSNEITRFFLNNYDTFESHTLSSITKGGALRKYQKLFEDRNYKYIDSLIKHAKLYSVISPIIDSDVDIKTSDSIDTELNQLMKLKVSQSYPLIMYLLDEFQSEHITEHTVNILLKYIINFFVRRNISMKPKASNIRAKIIDIIRRISSDELIKDEDKLINLVKAKLNSISVSDSEFKEALMQPVYDVSPKTVRFILIYLERKYGSYFNKQNPDSLDKKQTTRSGRELPIWTLEHILPETPNLKNGWPNMISPDNPDNAKNIQTTYMHMIGNLTLTGYNSEMSDKSFLDKREYKPKGSNKYTGLRTQLFLNKSLSKKTRWTTDDIMNRTEMLANYTVKAFPLKPEMEI